MTALASTLALLQVADSQFPAGTFAHSYGLEQLVRDGWVRDVPALDSAVRSIIELQSAQSDARAVVRARVAAEAGDLASLCSTDAALFRMKAAEEARAASVATGTRLLREVVPHDESATLTAFCAEVSAGRTPGTHPVAFGVVGAALGIPAQALAGALVLGSATVLLSAAMRLFSVSHRDVQGILHRLRPLIAEVAGEAAASAETPFAASHPLQEIASMRHRDARARFFAS